MDQSRNPSLCVQIILVGIIEYAIGRIRVLWAVATSFRPHLKVFPGSCVVVHVEYEWKRIGDLCDNLRRLFYI